MAAPEVVGALVVRVLPEGPELTFDGSRAVTIGRDEHADLVVADPRASRRHAIVQPVADEGWVIEDHSTNGIFSANTRVARLLVAGAVTIRIGDPTAGTEIRLTARPAAAAPAPAAAGPTQQPAMPSPLVAASPGVASGGPAMPPGMVRPPAGTGVGLGHFSSLYEPVGRLRVGRAEDNDIVVPDLLVSRYHAELQPDSRGAFWIVDLGSHNGTFVDGQRVERRTALAEGSIVSIGHHQLRLHAGKLEEYIDTGDVSFAAHELSVLAGPKVLLDGVSFCLDAGSFLAVLGPTGAGKSTLLKALTGSRPADRGSVLYNGRDLYLSYAELRHRLGYVPQDDILHTQLTVRAALTYAAQLRFPADVSDQERMHRVEEVMGELGLSERADLPVGKLSGGQRKRTSVALELLTRPSLLLLDEPTSGLDPGYEKSVMDLLRNLADGGRTVITVTHSIQSLDRCDRILFLAPGGQTAYFGPPDEALEFFGRPQYAEVFQYLDHAEPGRAKHDFTGSPPEMRYVKEPLAAHHAQAAAAPSAVAHTPEAGKDNPSWGHQLWTLLRRYLSVILADRRNTALLLAQAPVLGILMFLVFGHDNLVQTPLSRATAATVLIGLILGVTYLGAANSIREIVKERPILVRERAIGLSPSAYVLSKVIVLGGLTIIQSVILVILGIARQGGPGHGALLPSGRFEVLVTVTLTGLAAMALGLLISSLVENADKALTLLPVVLFAQFLLTGAVFNLAHTPVLNQLGFLNGSRWGYSALASSANLDAINGQGCNGTVATPGPHHAVCDFAHRHSSGIWLLDVAVLVLLIVIAVTGSWLALRPVGQPRRK